MHTPMLLKEIYILSLNYPLEKRTLHYVYLKQIIFQIEMMTKSTLTKNLMVKLRLSTNSENSVNKRVGGFITIH